MGDKIRTEVSASLILSVDDLAWKWCKFEKYNHSAFPSGYDIFLTQVTVKQLQCHITGYGTLIKPRIVWKNIMS